MPKKNKYHLAIDCSSFLYAAFYTTGLLAYDGKPTGIIYGFLRKTIKFAERFNTRHVYFCWDHPTNFRKDAYPLYKFNRIKASPEDLLDKKERDTQAKELRHDTLKAMGFMNHLQQRGYEGDDMLAALAKILNGKHIIMVTADADMYQCLDLCDIVNPTTGKIMTRKIFEEKYKVHPSQWPICKSIGGCFGDNVIGIKGAADPAKSEKSKAIRYVRGELSNGIIYDRIESEEGKQIIKRNLPIVTCPYKPEDMKTIILRRNKCTKRKFIDVFSRYNFRSMLETKHFDKWEKIFLRG
jgi:DNA polymerase-1